MPASVKAQSSATESELRKWFSLEKYEELKQFNALDWARLVADRRNIKRAVEGGNLDVANDCWTRIVEAPLAWLGSDTEYIGPTHESNTATVKSLSVKRLRCISAEVSQIEDSQTNARLSSGLEAAIVDQILADYPHSDFHRYAHVMIAADAPPKQIVADFEKWLDQWLSDGAKLPHLDYREGDYLGKARERWIPHRAVQSFDLDLYECITEKAVRGTLRWSLLFPGVDGQPLESQKKKTRDATKFLFSEDTYRALSHLGYELRN